VLPNPASPLLLEIAVVFRLECFSVGPVGVARRRTRAHGSVAGSQTDLTKMETKSTISKFNQDSKIFNKHRNNKIRYRSPLNKGNTNKRDRLSFLQEHTFMTLQQMFTSTKMYTEGDLHDFVGTVILLRIDTYNCSVGFKPYKSTPFSFIPNPSAYILYNTFQCSIILAVLSHQMGSIVLAGSLESMAIPMISSAKNEWTPQDGKRTTTLTI
jgi:hypothetical protein